ncbi:MAG: DUF4943 family protein [Bacteroidia bacterium]|nr:DUF4943 family protein [Bacteroidia bacterium]
MNQIGKWIVFCFAAGLLLAACGPDTREVRVLVQDRDSKRALDSAMVVLVEYAGTRETPADTAWTGKDGRATLACTPRDGMAYYVKTSRRFYQPPLNADGSSYASQRDAWPGDTARVLLLLEAIPLPDVGVIQQAFAPVPAAKFAGDVRANLWNKSYLPAFAWEDIATLLTAVDDSALISNYPYDARASYRPDSVRAGLAVLWAVEAIRLQTLRNAPAANVLSAPSQAPVLTTSGGGPKRFNSTDALRRAAAAYRAWWQTARDAEDRAAAAKANPLAGLDLRWR